MTTDNRDPIDRRACWNSLGLAFDRAFGNTNPSCKTQALESNSVVNVYFDMIMAEDGLVLNQNFSNRPMGKEK